MLEKIKNTFKNVSSRNGSYSVGMIALVVAIVVVINLIAGQLPENVKSIDVSDKKIYQISKTSKKILNKLDSDITFTVYAQKKSTDDRIKAFLKKYAALSDKITVKWVDPVLHPGELTKNNVEENMILVSDKKTKKTTTVSFSDIIVTDEYSYYTTGSSTESEFDGEGQLTSAVNYVTSDTQKKIYYTSGHGEGTFSTSVTDLLGKSNIKQEELNLVMKNKIPDDCDLLFIYAPTKDLTKDEVKLLNNYMDNGGKIYVVLGDADKAQPNLKSFLKKYGIQEVSGYIADTQRSYQGNYYYIFPELTATGNLAKGLSSDMVLLVNAHGLKVSDPEDDTVTTTEFMKTSSSGYAISDNDQKQGTYTLGVVAEKSKNGSDDSDGETDSSDIADTGRLTVVSSDSLINPDVTDNMSTLENLDLFMNTVTANYDDVENVSIKAKSLQVTYNTVHHAGIISLFIIFGIPVLILVYGFIQWWKRRKA